MHIHIDPEAVLYTLRLIYCQIFNNNFLRGDVQKCREWWSKLRVSPNPLSGNGVLSHMVFLFEVDLHQLAIKVISDDKI